MIGLLLVPLFVGGIAFYFFREITWKEFLLQIAVTVVAMVGGYQLAKWGSMQDIEYLNGHITEKLKGTEGCCHCREVCVSTDKNGSCTSYVTECDHILDYWWALDTSVGTIGIESCSPSSADPKEWVRAKVGEPATVESMYTNYLLADKDSIVRHDVLNKYGARVPKYPGVFSFYKRRPVVTDGVPVPKGWQEFFAKTNDSLGSKKQLDLVVVLTKAKDPTFAQAVESKWLYGPKNSFTVVLGVEGNTVAWARGVSLSEVSDLKIRVRDELQGVPLVDAPARVRELVEKDFHRTPMSKFEYLSKSATPGKVWMIFLYVLAVLLSVGVSVLMHRKEIFR